MNTASTFSALKAFALASVAVVGLTAATQTVQAATFTAIDQANPLTMTLVAEGGKSQTQKGAENFIGTMAKRALDFLGNAQQTKAQKAESFRRLLEDNYDMDTIGRFTLGRYWKVATPQQQNEYLKLFRKRVVDMYSERFSEYKGQSFEVVGSRPDGEQDTIVSSKIVPTDSNQEILVEWRVRYKGGHYRVVDVIVEGVSMSMTQRSDFSSVIQQGGGDVQVLIDNLKQRG